MGLSCWGYCHKVKLAGSLQATHNAKKKEVTKEKRYCICLRLKRDIMSILLIVFSWNKAWWTQEEEAPARTSSQKGFAMAGKCGGLGNSCSVAATPSVKRKAEQCAQKPRQALLQNSLGSGLC